jgi:TBC1 domain family protein 5
MPFFQDKHILKLLSLILFIWCRRNPDVSYKQGMNELLASVVVCYFKEA